MKQNILSTLLIRSLIFIDVLGNSKMENEKVINIEKQDYIDFDSIDLEDFESNYFKAVLDLWCHAKVCGEGDASLNYYFDRHGKSKIELIKGYTTLMDAYYDESFDERSNEYYLNQFEDRLEDLIEKIENEIRYNIQMREYRETHPLLYNEINDDDEDE